MKRALTGRTAAIVVAGMVVLGCVSASKLLAAGTPTTIRFGNLLVRAEDTTSPSALPESKMAPIVLHARGSVETIDGSHVPAAQTVELQIDRHFKIESDGLPSCTVGRIQATSPSGALKACGPALIGRGSATAEVEFPESAPFSTRGPLLGFNGPTIGGYSEMLYYVYVAVPAPTALVVVAKLSKDSGKYAYKVALTIPTLAGGSGSLTGFEITIGRKWTYGGRRHSYLSADCPDGHFLDQLEAAFADGTHLEGSLGSACQAKD
jgi:hypothetical protein